MKKILVVNDDGIEAKGIKALVQSLKSLGEVIAVAPSEDRSGTSHSISIGKPFQLSKVAHNMYKVKNASPADCVYIALNTVFKDCKPDLIVSGINQGANLAEDTSYSGTVGATIEAVLHGFKAFAISQVRPKGVAVKSYEYDFELAGQTAVDVATKILDGLVKLDERSFLNVNIPPVGIKQSKGYQITQCGYKIYDTFLKEIQDAYGGSHYWAGVTGFNFGSKSQQEIITDEAAIKNGYISITPLKVDMTDTAAIEAMQAVFTNCQK